MLASRFLRRSGSEESIQGESRPVPRHSVSVSGSAQESGEGRILGGFLKNPSEDVRDWKPRSWSGAPMGELIRNLLKQLGSGRTQPGSIDR